MTLLNGLYLSVLVIAFALISPRRESGGQTAVGNNLLQPPHIAATKEEIRFYLGDLNRAVDRQGEMKLLFPACLAFAAPFLLYRLKRMGFSNCCALMTEEGLILTAIR